LLKKLINSHHKIVVAGRRPIENTAITNTAITNTAIDLRDSESIQASILEHKPNIVMHLAASGVADGNRDFQDLLRINTVSTVAIAESLVTLDHPTCLIMAGSGFEYGDHPEPITEANIPKPLNGYGVTKLAATHALRLYSDRISIAVLRIFGVYGPGEADHRLVPYSIGKAIAGEEVDVTPGEQVRDFLHVSDAAGAFEKAAAWASSFDSGFEVFNLGSGRPLQLKQLLQHLSSSLSSVGVEAKFNYGARPYRDDEVMSYVANIDKIQNMIGWNPTIEIANGLTEVVEGLTQ